MTAMVARIRIFPPSGEHSDDWRYRFPQSKLDGRTTIATTYGRAGRA